MEVTSWFILYCTT